MFCVYIKLYFSAGIRFEVFNFETKQFISKTKLHDPVLYWTWVNQEVIAMVTESLIYHWHVWNGMYQYYFL